MEDILFTTRDGIGFVHFEEGLFNGLGFVCEVEKSYEFWEGFLLDFLKIGFYENYPIFGTYSVALHKPIAGGSLGSEVEGFFFVKNTTTSDGLISIANYTNPGTPQVLSEEIFPKFFTEKSSPKSFPPNTIGVLYVDKTMDDDFFATLVPKSVEYFPEQTNFSLHRSLMVQLSKNDGNQVPLSKIDRRLASHYQSLQPTP